MPRRGFVPKREVLDDPIYGGKLVTKLINQVMLDGKRGTAQKACYGAFDIIREKTGREPLEVFQEAMNNVMPVLEVKARRIGGSTYQVPLEIRAERRQTLGLRWIVQSYGVRSSAFWESWYEQRCKRRGAEGTASESGNWTCIRPFPCSF